MIHLDGRTLEGGGQLVRIAVALSALTGKSVNISHIRGNRKGKKGLKRSHLAAVQFLAQLTGSSVSGAEVGSSSLSFYPVRSPLNDTGGRPIYGGLEVKGDIGIELPTAGSVFLVFQAIYPYILYAAAGTTRLTLTGGTNVSFSPSFDYISQVLVPNLAALGLPSLAVHLEKRGWATGPVSLGKVALEIEPLGAQDRSRLQFPQIDLSRFERGRVTRIDLTVLAPDDPLEGETQTIRELIESEAHRRLRTRLATLPPWVCVHGSGRSDSFFERGEDAMLINTHESEPTRHPSQIYLLLVAHTSTGFRIGHDALWAGMKAGKRQTTRRDHAGPAAVAVTNLVETCVDEFIRELYDPQLQPDPATALRRPCVDETMRDQLVVFEALGGKTTDGQVEDERFWSLHTLTAQWVCRQMLEE